MNKKENRMAVRQAAQQAVIRDEQNHRIQYMATNPVREVLKSLHTTLCGLDVESVSVSRTKYGTNKVTHDSNPVLPGSRFYHDRYDFSVFFSVREFAGRF